jgi:hypothetical protein
MKKTTTFMLLALMMLPATLAYASISQTTQTVTLVQKNPVNWETVPGGIGQVTLSYNLQIPNNKVEYPRARVTVYGMQPKTEYTLIYYGNEEVNDEWPYITCITNFKTSTQGYAKSTSGRINHLGFLNDEVPQKMWVILTSDADCQNGVMTNWNPNQYLFETETV